MARPAFGTIQEFRLETKLISAYLECINLYLYYELVGILTQHFQPKLLVIAERFYFHCRDQAPGESVAKYVAELRRLSTHCQFDTCLDQALCDRLVCGLRNESVKKHLLAETALILQRAMELAQGMEAAKLNVKALKGTAVALQKNSCQQPNSMLQLW